MAMNIHISLGWADEKTCDHALHTQIQTKVIATLTKPVVQSGFRVLFVRKSSC